MNREDIIRMAREASNTPIDHHATPDLFGVSQIERFAALVAAAERNRKDWNEYEREIAAAEREACAKQLDEDASYYVSAGTVGHTIRKCAAAIRARGQA